MKSKIKLYLLLFISSLFLCSASLQASKPTIGSADIKQYINDLSLVQNQIFSLAQYATFPTESVNATDLKTSFNTLDKSLDTISKEIFADLSKLPNQSPYISELRLLLNVTNSMHNALYELTNILDATDSTEKMVILERYFNYRLSASSTLQFINQLLSTT